MKPIRKIPGGLLVLGGCVAVFILVHAQETATPDPSLPALTAVEVMLQAPPGARHRSPPSRAHWRAGRFCENETGGFATEP